MFPYSGLNDMQVCQIEPVQAASCMVGEIIRIAIAHPIHKPLSRGVIEGPHARAFGMRPKIPSVRFDPSWHKLNQLSAV